MLKNTIALSLIFASLSAFAAGNGDIGSVVDPSNCPEGTELIQVCKSTPQKGDHEVAAGMLDAITICQKGQKAVMAIMKSGQIKKGKVDQVVMRVGGASYTVHMNEGTELEIGIPMGIRSKEALAKLTIHMKAAGLQATSTYTCQRQ